MSAEEFGKSSRRRPGQHNHGRLSPNTTDSPEARPAGKLPTLNFPIPSGSISAAKLCCALGSTMLTYPGINSCSTDVSSTKTEIQRNATEGDFMEKETQISRISKQRALFNINKETLPAIGNLTPDADYVLDKPAKMQKNSDVYNDVIDVITKHEQSVKTTSMLKEIGQYFMNNTGQFMNSRAPDAVNHAPEVIEKLEMEIGRAYQKYGGWPGYQYRRVRPSSMSQYHDDDSRCSTPAS